MQFGAGTPFTRAKSHISPVVQDGEQFRPRLRELVEQVIVDEKQIVIKVRHAALLSEDFASRASEEPGTGTIELTTAVDFKRRGVETKVVLPGLAQQSVASRCDPALIKAVVRGRAWFEELATRRVRSLEDLTKRDGISRRYIRRLVDLAFLSPRIVDAILEGRQPVTLTATRVTELDLPLDWAEQHKLLAS
jgi:site-specific DNA recombinase